MASFKRLKRSDVISVPYVANKNWVFEYCPYPKDQYIKLYKGTNVTGSFSTKYDAVTEGQYERLIYSQINHLFYQNYSSSNQNLNTSSLISSLYYDGASQNRLTGSYFNYNDNPGLIRTLPTGAMEGIRILAINQDLYGQQVLPYAFELSSSVYYVKDDGIGNLIDYKNSNTYIGNIFYSHGLAVVTHQDYQLMWPLPPLAQFKQVSFLDTDATKTVDLSTSIDGRSGQVDLSTLKVSGPYASLCTVSSVGTLTFNASDPGIYTVYYTFDAIIIDSSCGLDNKTLTSNQGILEIIIRCNCGFNVSVVETTTAAPTTPPTTSPTPAPVTSSPTTPPTTAPTTPAPTTAPTTPAPSLTPPPTTPPTTPPTLPPTTPPTPSPVPPTYTLLTRCADFSTGWYWAGGGTLGGADQVWSGGGYCYFVAGSTTDLTGLTPIYGTLNNCPSGCY
jgi:cell division septation protein DedD